MAWAKAGGSHLITLGELHLLGAPSAEFGFALGHLRWLVELKTFPDDKKEQKRGFQRGFPSFPLPPSRAAWALRACFHPTTPPVCLFIYPYVVMYSIYTQRHYTYICT